MEGWLSNSGEERSPQGSIEQRAHPPHFAVRQHAPAVEGDAALDHIEVAARHELARGVDAAAHGRGDLDDAWLVGPAEEPDAIEPVAVHVQDHL